MIFGQKPVVLSTANTEQLNGNFLWPFHIVPAVSTKVRRGETIQSLLFSGVCVLCIEQKF